MTIYNDPFQGLPAPSDFELQADFNRRRHLADKRETREALAEAEQRITRLEAALASTIHAIAFSQTMEAAWFDEPAERHLARAAHTLGLNLADLGLKYTESADEP
jgi:multidrug resistance efflux pump